ncbi:MAG: GDP-mannose 4,6-dehydratase [Candidatus Obscuribacterales bacterium]|nr:GDP-mannose 4,6-dehydratase [Candidatus Obscuribacterales bacterium]
MFQGKTVLVTGCAGFLGSWLSRTLVQKGANVIGIDRDYKPESMIHELKGDAELIEGTIEDLDLMLSIVRDRKTEFIFHLAAQSIVGIANNNPLDTFKSNIEGTWNVLETARQLGQTSDKQDRRLRGIILASSDKAYGDQDVLPYVEDAPMQGRFPYDVSKSCADLIARSYYLSYKVPVCTTRCGNLFGAGDLNLSRIVPDTLTHVLRGEPVTIRSNGKPVRDYLYIKDAVNAYLMLAERMWNDSSVHGEAFNISNQAPMSVIECVDKILAVTGREDLKPIIQGTATREIEEQFLDATKINAVLGWKPQYDFKAGLQETVGWYKDLVKSGSSMASIS